MPDANDFNSVNADSLRKFRSGITRVLISGRFQSSSMSSRQISLPGDFDSAGVCGAAAFGATATSCECQAGCEFGGRCGCRCKAGIYGGPRGPNKSKRSLRRLLRLRKNRRKLRQFPSPTGEILDYNVSWATFSEAATIRIARGRAAQSLWLGYLASAGERAAPKIRCGEFLKLTTNSIPIPTL